MIAKEKIKWERKKKSKERMKERKNSRNRIKIEKVKNKIIYERIY